MIYHVIVNILYASATINIFSIIYYDIDAVLYQSTALIVVYDDNSNFDN